MLQAGPNASVDYYLRPRLEAQGLDWRITDLTMDPQQETFLDRQGLVVVLCRYTNRAWMKALAQRTSSLWGIVHFIDDDLDEMMKNAALPWTIRGKVAHGYGRHIQTMEQLSVDQWVSTTALAKRLGRPASKVVSAVCCDLPTVALGDEPLHIVYHGSDTHLKERMFVVDIARRMAKIAPDLTFEITGSRRLARTVRDLPNVDVVPQTSWPDYRRYQVGRRASVFLAPLLDTPLNQVRAPVKMFDAARLGAVGLYADAAPYSQAIEHGKTGLLVPMQASAWVEAIMELTGDSDLRRRLTCAAYDQIQADRAAMTPLPLSCSAELA